MNPKILLIGNNGQIGAELEEFLPRIGEVVAVGRQRVDLSKPDQIRRIIKETRPHIVVNAAAYTAVDKAESDEPMAQAINADAPAVMAEEVKRIDALLVHFSTDYVFDGSKPLPYDEGDPPNPVNVYGKTKLAGEQAIRSAGTMHLIFRTAWVYGKRGRNFLLTILRLATKREELFVVNDQIGSPTWSREIAYATAVVLGKIQRSGKALDSFAELGGTYHMTATSEASWCAFAQAILEEASQITHNAPWFRMATDGQPIISRRVIPSSSAEYPTPAARPAHSLLSNARLARAFGCGLAPWRTQLHSLFL
jgi:dTDP-4-dehydrorhamnose reductase